MAIEKKLIHFSKLSDFETQLNAGNILDYSIVFIQDAKKIWTHGQYYDCNGGSSVDLSEYLTADEIAEIYATIESLNGKQDALVSGNNIKTINGESILGEGNLIIEGGGRFFLPLSLFAETPTISQEDYDNLVNAINNGRVIYIPSETGLSGSVISVAQQGIVILLICIETLYNATDIAIVIQNDLTVTVIGETTYPKASKLSQLENDSNFISSDNLKTINGESIVGSGDIVIGGGSSSIAYTEVSHGTSDTTFTLTPNTFHIWDEVSSLTLTLGAEASGIANEYLFQFTSGSTATTLSLPDDIKWAGGEAPTIEANKIYQVSILKGLGSVLEWDAVTLITFSVGGILYEAVEGMTWEQWINSEYNINNYYIESNIVRVDSENRVALQDSYAGISPTAVIQKDYSYRKFFDD